jgi:hypothetical protein
MFINWFDQAQDHFLRFASPPQPNEGVSTGLRSFHFYRVIKVSTDDRRRCVSQIENAVVNEFTLRQEKPQSQETVSTLSISITEPYLDFRKKNQIFSFAPTPGVLQWQPSF